MVSVMNTNDLELDKPESVQARASGGSADVIRTGFSDSVASAEREVSGDGVSGGSDGGGIHRGGGAGSSENLFGSTEVRPSPESDPDSGFSVEAVSLEDKGPDRFRVFDVDDEGEMKPEGSGTKPLKGVKPLGKKKMEKSVKVKKPKPKNEVGLSNAGKSIVTGKSKSVGYGHKLEDQVWGKVKSHPWWPGFIYDEGFAEASVLRLKKPGLVLVAFFGDGSYGYFDPAELIPFEPNFSEKSRQSKHSAPKIFQKAVDEAIDEVCRRSALGLTCRCRNPYNFRPATVEGYKAVDVVDYEPGAVYSTSMIKEARDKFQPRDMLSFLQKSALMGRENKPAELDFMKDKATVLAYRRAVFEEFDETYAQAFGQTPVRPTREPVESLVPARAHLSGPMVTAEALGKKKKYAKHPKTADKVKKDGYLFKRRDEPPNEVKRPEVVEATSSVPVPDSAAGDFILQKRKPAVSSKPKKIPKKQQEAVHRDKSSGLANGGKVEAPSSSADTPPLKRTPSLENLEKGEANDPGTLGSPGLGTSQVDTASHIPEDIPKVVDGSVLPEVEQAQGEGSALAVGGAIPGKQGATGTGTGSGTKKPKPKKRSAGEMVPEKSGSVEKKKRKKDLGEEMSSDPVQILGSAGKVSGKAVQFGLSAKDDFRIEPRKKDGATPAVVTDSSQPARVGTESSELLLSGLLGGLRRLAIDPLLAIEEGVNLAAVRQDFLRYRSLVYQKSLPLSTAVEVVPAGTATPKAEASDIPQPENVKESPSPRPPKPVKQEDLAKGGRKRGPSDRQEGNSLKKAKRISDAKSAALEKKQVLKNPPSEVKKEVGSASRPAKSVKPEPPAKKTAPAPRRPEPTILVMKFPPDTSLPSPSELKARLARFGPLDHSYTRVFWTSSTCRVMYRFRSDAEAAHRHLVGKNTLFGHVSLRCHLKPLEGAQPEPERNPREDPHAEAAAQRDSSVEQRGPFAPQMSPASQLRSCLKKPVPEETPAAPAAAAGGGSGGGNGGGGSSSSSRAGPRVKFVLGENSGGGGDQTMMIGNKNPNNSSSFPEFAGSASLSSPSSFDFNARSFQRPPPPPQPNSHPLLPLPSHFQPRPPPVPLHFHNAPPPPGNFRYTEPPPPQQPPRMHNFHPNMVAQVLPPPPPPPVVQPLPPPPPQLQPPPPPQREDISGPFLSLLHKNFKLLTELEKMPGFKAYCPL